MTSNIGSPQILEAGQAGASYEELKATVFGMLQQQFRPEFLNRIDDVIVFHGLSRDQVGDIARIQIGLLQGRLAERRIELDVTRSAMELLARQGYDPVFGARPLKRLIREKIETPLAKQLIAGEIEDGQTVTVTGGSDGQLDFATREEATAVN